MYNTRKIGALVTALLLAGVLSGCNVVDKTVDFLVTKQPQETKGNQVPKEPTKEQTEEQTNGGEVSKVPNPPKGAKQEPITESNESVEVVLYFINEKADALTPEKRRIKKVTGLAKKTLEELIVGPITNSKLTNPLPEGTKVLDLNVKSDGLAVVDFSKEIKTNHSGGSLGESLTVYSVVNTLTQFPTVTKVQILVEGERVESLAGHLDLSLPFERNPDLIKAK